MQSMMLRTACAAVPAASRVRAAAMVQQQQQKSFQKHQVRRYASEAKDDLVDDEAPAAKPAAEAAPAETGPTEQFEFKAETQQLLDIVIRSVYTDKEIYVRELISNASDALEKRRHLELTQTDEWGPEPDDEPPCIKIDVNSDTRQFVVSDTGVGMTKEELVKNIGTICSSGSKEFVRRLRENQGTAADSIIGQFGVGFYSAFMIANHIKVYTRSAQKGSQGYCWESDGTGSYSIYAVDGLKKGTKIVCDVRETEVAFCAQSVVERIIKKYSNFVAYEIFLNGARINTVEALWMKPKDEVTNEEHTEFYKFIANAYDTPRFRLHYSIDCPLNINALMYVPQTHTERMNLQRMEPGLSLYCRKVLIQAKCRALVPEYLRFVKGVVDSEDIPLNLSREMTQDSALMRKLSSVITKKILKWLHDEAVKDPEGYAQFFEHFGQFLKEGVCTDAINKTDLARLLRFNSSACEDGRQSVSLDDYIARMPESQSNIYFLQVPNREAGLVSPYYEAFKAKGLEVIFLTHPADHIVMTHLDMYKKHKVVSAESADPSEKEGKSEENEELAKLMKKELTEEQGKELTDFLQRVLQTRVLSVKVSKRLTSSPAIITDHEQASMQKFMKTHGIMSGNEQQESTKHHLQVNPKHDIIRKLYTIATSNDARSEKLGKLVAEQVFDNALIAANLLDDPRSILSRVTDLMEEALATTPEPMSLSKDEDSAKEEEPKASSA
ncbi:TNF receptor-associated protein 1-like protein [Diplonema papillatum]|nr:TNF receptor-associated protein 1-like protein [Diplonema papillatum]